MWIAILLIAVLGASWYGHQKAQEYLKARIIAGSTADDGLDGFLTRYFGFVFGLAMLAFIFGSAMGAGSEGVIFPVLAGGALFVGLLVKWNKWIEKAHEQARGMQLAADDTARQRTGDYRLSLIRKDPAKYVDPAYVRAATERKRSFDMNLVLQEWLKGHPAQYRFDEIRAAEHEPWALHVLADEHQHQPQGKESPEDDHSDVRREITRRVRGPQELLEVQQEMEAAIDLEHGDSPLGVAKKRGLRNEFNKYRREKGWL